MNKLTILLFSLFVCSYAGAESNPKLSAHDIMVKNDEARKVDTCISEAKLTMSGSGSVERKKDFTWWRKLSSDGIHYNTLTRFHFPPEIRGEGILFIEHSNAENDIQLYLPSFKKIRRVETDQQSQGFMGSEFSYSDITSAHVNDHVYKMLRTESCPNEKAVTCWVISSIPSTDQIKDQTGSISGTVWIRQDNFMIVHGEYNDIEGKPWKVLDATKNEEVDKVKHKWMALDLKMVNVKTHHLTQLSFTNVKVNQPIPDSTFTVENLSREK